MRPRTDRKLLYFGVESATALLAVPSTVTAVCLSNMAGWQRGGFVAEPLLGIAVGVALVIGTHLLPALSDFVDPILLDL